MFYAITPGNRAHVRRRFLCYFVTLSALTPLQLEAQTAGSPFNIQPQNASFDQSNAVSVYNPDDNELAVVYVRETMVPDSSDPFTARRDEVRATIYNATDMSVIADDVMILQQAVPNDTNGCRPNHMQFDNVDVAYNTFTGEYVVAAGGQIDPDGPCLGGGPAVQDVGQIWVQRFATGTAAPIGAAYILSNGPGGNSVEEFVFGAEVGIACSSANGNTLLAYGRAVNGVGDTVVAGILLSPALVMLNTGGSIMGQDLSSATGPALFALHFLHSNNVSFDPGRGLFMVPWFNQYTGAGVRFSSPDLHLRTVNDTLSTTTSLDLGPNNKLVESDLMGSPDTSFDGGEDHEVVNRGFSKPIRNPFSTSGDSEFVIAFQWDKLGTLAADPAGGTEMIDTQYPYDGLRLQFFGLTGGGATFNGPTAEVLSLAESATEVRFPRLVPLTERQQFAIVWIDTLQSQQGYANNAAWQLAPPEMAGTASLMNRDIKYVITNGLGARTFGFGTAGATLRTGAADLPIRSGDSPFIAYAPPGAENGRLLATWEERTASGQSRHPVGVWIEFDPLPMLDADGWQKYE